MKKLLFILSITFISSLNAQTLQTGSQNVKSKYIVTFDKPGLASYGGGIESFEATSPAVTGARKLDLKSAASVAYLAYLKNESSQIQSDMSQLISRNVQPIYEYYYANFGIAVELTEAEARQITNIASIIAIEKEKFYELDTDVGPTFIGANTIWDGSNMPANIPNQGEGLVLGIIDTGINMDHPSFSDSPEDLYDYASANPLGAGNFVAGSDCSQVYVCNNKLIGAWDFADDVANENDGPEDSSGHGSHTASTAAGNKITSSSIPGGFVTSSGIHLDAPSISGVAPHAHIIAYDVCITTCSSVAITSAINQAISDGVDVISFSISGGTNPWSNSDSDRLYLNAVNAGIVVSTSAGNTGNGITDPIGQVNHRGPWLLSVANSSHNRILSNDVQITQPTPVPSNLSGIYGLLGVADNFGGVNVDAGLLYSGNVNPGNEEGCNAFPANSFNGKIALIIRGSCNFSQKIDNAEAAGAVAAIIYNNSSDIPIVMGGIETTNIPAVMIGFSDGDNIVSFIAGVVATNVEAIILGTPLYSLVDALGNILNTSSLLGPNEDFDVTKPDINGPGTNIFAAYRDGTAAPQFNFLSGTSMSAPHIAGSALLMVKAHPDWSPSEIKSAIMMTADDDVHTNAGNPATPDEVGSGTVDLTLAAKSILVMDETFTNYVNANPLLLGDPATLNIPSVRSNNCSASCSWTRTVTNKSSSTYTWATSEAKYTDEGLITVTPSSFELAAGASAAFTVTYTACSGTLNDVKFGDVKLYANDNTIPFSRITVAAVPTALGDCSGFDLIYRNGFEPVVH